MLLGAKEKNCNPIVIRSNFFALVDTPIKQNVIKDFLCQGHKSYIICLVEE